MGPPHSYLEPENSFARRHLFSAVVHRPCECLLSLRRMASRASARVPQDSSSLSSSRAAPNSGRAASSTASRGRGSRRPESDSEVAEESAADEEEEEGHEGGSEEDAEEEASPTYIVFSVDWRALPLPPARPH